MRSIRAARADDDPAPRSADEPIAAGDDEVCSGGDTAATRSVPLISAGRSIDQRRRPEQVDQRQFPVAARPTKRLQFDELGVARDVIVIGRVPNDGRRAAAIAAS